MPVLLGFSGVVMLPWLANSRFFKAVVDAALFLSALEVRPLGVRDCQDLKKARGCPFAAVLASLVSALWRANLLIALSLLSLSVSALALRRLCLNSGFGAGFGCRIPSLRNNVDRSVLSLLLCLVRVMPFNLLLIELAVHPCLPRVSCICCARICAVCFLLLVSKATGKSNFWRSQQCN